MAAVILPSAMAAETQEDSFEVQSRLLKDLGILRVNVENPDASVNRGMFVDMAMRTCFKELPSFEKATTFDDVIPNYEFKDAVEAAYGCGIIKGTSENVFGVNEMITQSTAAAVMLRILNYEEYINALGDDSNKYLRVAGEIGLIKNVQFSKDTFNFRDAVQLLYNAIRLSPMKVSESNSGKIKYERAEGTLIYEKLGIDEVYGTVTGAAFASLDGSGAPGKGNVKIGGEIYSVGISGAEDYIGYSVHVYYDNDTKTIRHIEDDRTDVTEIDSSEKPSYSGGTLKYFADGKRTKNITIPSDAIIVYNGALVRNGQFGNELFDLDAGTINVIKNAYGSHTAVVIRSYTDTVFGKYTEDGSRYVLINKFDSDKNIIIEDTENFEIRDTEGNVLDIGDIPEEAVLSAAISLDGKSGDFVVNKTSNKLTLALVMSCSEDKTVIKTYNEKIHTYEEKEYELTKSFSKINEEKRIVLPGREYTAYINAFGRIAYMSEEKDMSDFYAYIISVYPIEESPDSELELKLFREDGKCEKYKLRENASIDGVNCKKKTHEEINGMLGMDSDTKSRLVYVSLTFDSEIKAIDTCLDETTEREDNYELYKSEREAENTLYKIDGRKAVYASNIPTRRRYAQATKTFDTGIFMTNTTKVMAVPRDSSDPDRFKMLTPAAFINDRSYLVKAYGRDDESIVPDVVVYYYWSRYSPEVSEGEDVGTATFARLPFERTYDAEVGIVTEFGEEVNPATNDVETAVTITNVRSGSVTKFYTVDSTLTIGVGKRQLVRYYALSGELCYLEKLYDFNTKSFNDDIRTIKWVNGKTSIPSYFLTHEDSEGNPTYLSDNYGATVSEDPVFGVARARITACNAAHMTFVTYDNYEKGNLSESYRKPYECPSLKVFYYGEYSAKPEEKKLADLIAYDESSLMSSEVIAVTKNRTLIGLIMY